jgi:hypothetical protein
MKIFMLSVIMLFFAFNANAACTRTDLVGTWVVYSTGSNAMAVRLTFTVPSKGDVIPVTFFNADLSTGTGTVNIGYFDKACHFAGNVSVNNMVTSSFDAYLSKGKDSMTGMWGSYIGNALQSGAFNGSKQ